MLAGAEGGGRPQPRDLLPEEVRRPAGIGLAAGRAHQEQALAGLPLVGHRQGDGEEISAPGVGGCAVALSLSPQVHRLASCQREHQRVIRLLQGQVQRFELDLGHPAGEDVLQRARVGVDQRADRLPRSGAIGQPVHRRPRALHRVLGGEQALGEGEPCRGGGFARDFRPPAALGLGHRAHFAYSARLRRRSAGEPAAIWALSAAFSASSASCVFMSMPFGAAAGA